MGKKEPVPEKAGTKPERGNLKKVSASLLILISLAILGWAGLRANAAWHFLAAQTISEPLFENGTGTAAYFEATESHLASALKRFPNNPDYLDMSGRLKVLMAGQPGIVGAEHRQLLEYAADDFRQALKNRPLWPYSWVNLLTAKDKLGQVDTEFNKALVRSAELGPWEPRVQLQIVDSGLRYWNRLGSDERELVRQKVQDASEVQPRSVFAIVRDYGRADLVCGDEVRHVQIRRWCAEVYAQEPG